MGVCFVLNLVGSVDRLLLLIVLAVLILITLMRMELLVLNALILVQNVLPKPNVKVKQTLYYNKIAYFLLIIYMYF